MSVSETLVDVEERLVCGEWLARTVEDAEGGGEGEVERGLKSVRSGSMAVVLVFVRILSVKLMNFR